MCEKGEEEFLKNLQLICQEIDQRLQCDKETFFSFLKKIFKLNGTITSEGIID